MAVGKKDYKDSQVRLKHKQKVPPQTLVKVEPSNDDTRTRAELLDAIEDLFQTVYTSTGASREVDLEDLRAILTMLVLSATNADDDGVGATQTQVDAINLNSNNIARNASDLATFISNISISNNKVGIGDSTPTRKLTVNGDIGLPNSGKLFLWDSHDANYLQYYRWELNSSLTAYINNSGSGGVALKTAGNTRLHIDNSGNVGIGTTSPSEKLEVDGSVKIQNNDAIKSKNVAGAARSLISLGSDNVLRIKGNDSEGSTNVLSMVAGGNVGVGTTSPARRLEVYNSSSSMISQFRSGSGTSSFICFANTASTADQVRIGSISSNLVLSTNYTERMRINSSGNVGIGTTSPSRTLHVKKTGDNEVARFESDQTSSYVELEDANTTGQILIGTQGDNFKIHTAGTERFRIDGSGNVGIGTTSTNTKLHVAGVTQITESGNTAFYGGDYVRLFNHQNFRIRNVGGSAIVNLSVSGNSYFNGGNVGIGQTSPAHKLDVAGYIRSANTGADSTTKYSGFFGRHYTNSEEDVLAISTESTSSNNNIYIGGGFGTRNSATTIRFSTAANSTTTTGSERMRIDSSGNVGIGTTSPGKFLDVNGTFRASGEAFLTGGFDITAAGRFRDGVALNFNTNRTARIFTDSNDLIIQQGEDDKDIIFKSDDGSGGVAEYLRIDGGVGYMVASKAIRALDGVNLQLGASADFTMQHNGVNTILQNFNGNLEITQGSDDGDIVFSSDDGSGGTTAYLTIDGSAEQTRFYKDTRHTDGIKANFGNSDDLQIYHDGSDSIIKDSGTGSLDIYSSHVHLKSSGGTNHLAQFFSGGHSYIYANNVIRIEATTSGVEITGDLSVSGSVQRQISTTHHTFTFGVAGSASQDYWVPFIGSSEQAAPNVTHRTIAPYTGILKKLSYTLL